MPAPITKTYTYRVYAGGELRSGFWCGTLVIKEVHEDVSQMWGQFKKTIKASGKFEALDDGGQWKALFPKLYAREGSDTNEVLFTLLDLLESRHRAAGPFLAIPTSVSH